ncbi:MAG: class I SAM-dependent methyltransferase [Actinomycetia bacterium]|nr:class I SAM-dependent methyltransferase [Actinomycetes bacterium]
MRAGEEFSREMGQWCSTSKFLSYTTRPDSLGYQDIYAQILRNLRGHDVRILEIGMGINDPTVKSGMSVDHRPGASLSGWFGYFPGAEIHGADVDRRCLIDTDQYKTHFADQLDPESLYDLASKLPGGLDIMVDDGLHTPEANVNVMAAFLPLLKPHGVMVIEDIVPDFDLLWFSASDYLPKDYRIDYFPSSVLRQFRARGGEGGLAVITRK